MKKSLILAVAASALALSGCATGLNTRVSRFQQLSAPNGQTFVVQSKDPALDGSLEFQHYADIVAGHMIQQGYTRASDPSHADLVVEAVTADAHSAAVLDVPRHAALLMVERLTRLEDGRPVDFEFIRFRGDRLTLRGTTRRQPQETP